MILQIQTDDKRISTWSTGQRKTELIRILGILAEYANELPMDEHDPEDIIDIQPQLPIETQYSKPVT